VLPGNGRDTASSRQLFASANYLLEPTMPVRIGAALNRRASPRARACPEQLIFDSRMRVLLCVSLTVPIIVCVSLHNGVIHRPLQNDGLDIRLCEPRLRARRQRRHEEAVYRHLGLCIRVACNVTHARDAVHFASAARARARARCRLCPAGWPSAAPSAAQRLR